MERTILENNLVLTPESDIVSSKVKELVEAAKKHMNTEEKYQGVILNLGKVSMIDSIGITFVIGLYKSASNMGKGFKVSGLNTDIKQLFGIMRLDQVFEIEATQIV
ncbi:MAG: STAS domain-containing protein [Clostridia bacterium]|nr:STAS domain-containing protein [Clostridia bacterium]